MNTSWRLTALLAFVLLSLLSLGAAIAIQSPEGVSGVIHFRDGRQVPFVHLGEPDKIGRCEILAYLGRQRVNYELPEIGEIHFANASTSYANPSTPQDEAVIVSRSGERFSLVYVEIATTVADQRSTGRFRYVYLDPVTKERRTGNDSFRHISHITLGPDVGPLKRNPETKQFFPAIYNFDPFTGQQLEWTKEPVPAGKTP